MSKTIEEEYIELAADYGVDVSVPERFYESQKLLMVEVIKHVHRLDDMVYKPKFILNPDGYIRPLDGIKPGGVALVDELKDDLMTFGNAFVKVTDEGAERVAPKDICAVVRDHDIIDNKHDTALDKQFTCGDCQLHGKRDCPLDEPDVIPSWQRFIPSWQHEACEEFKHKHNDEIEGLTK